MEATPQMTMIVDGKTGDTITLMNTQKKIVRISGDKAKAIAEIAAKYGGANKTKPKLVATGKKMTINGYEADEYLAESKQFKAHYWIAQSFPSSAAVLKQLQAIVPAAWNDLAKGMIDYRDLPASRSEPDDDWRRRSRQHGRRSEDRSTQRRRVFAAKGFSGNEDSECPGDDVGKTGTGGFGQTVAAFACATAFDSRVGVAAPA